MKISLTTGSRMSIERRARIAGWRNGVCSHGVRYGNGREPGVTGRWAGLTSLWVVELLLEACEHIEWKRLPALPYVEQF